MAYCTVSQMIALFGELEIRQLSQLYNPSAITIDTVRVEAAIAYAEEVINSYLAVRYTLPLASVPFVLGGKAADIARYQLDSVNHRVDVRQRYEDALLWLARMVAGKIDLGLAIDGTTGLPQEVSSDSYGVAILVPDLTFNVEGY